MRKSSLIVVLLVLLGSEAFAQLVVVPISRQTSVKKPANNARTRPDSVILTPMELPFWDDFSFSDTLLYPHDTIWQYGRSVELNYGLAINPPSLGVVTFDGVDSIGKPYNIANPFNKGYADKLISRPIRLDLVPVSGRDSVHMSFYYQAFGNGEDPDVGSDLLSVDFLDTLGAWVNVFATERLDLDPTVFYYAQIKISDKKFFHENFQFRFRNFGRLSGPYDTWNVDYVYVNKGIADSRKDFPDRTIASPIGSLFKGYYAMPKKHFLTDVVGHLDSSSFTVYNLSSTFFGQSLSADFTGTVVSYLGGAPTSYTTPDSTFNVGALPPFTRFTLTFPVPDYASKFDPLADSFKVSAFLHLNSSDNIPRTDTTGDYDVKIYSPIDFRQNDTLRVQQYLSNYYAYDDGTAEYGIGLNQANTQVAYLFNMMTPDPDTIVAVDIYFPRFGAESSQVITLRILRDLDDTQASVIYEEGLTVQLSEHNRYVRYNLGARTAGVLGSFYIGWRQNTTALIPVGWDKNTDSGDKLFYNTNGGWIQNSLEHGSMMIRPVFGKGDTPTGVLDVPQVNAFPNPNAGTFYISGIVEQVQLFDLAGRSIPFYQQTLDQQTKIEIVNPQPGMYVLKTYNNRAGMTQKIMVRP